MAHVVVKIGAIAVEIEDEDSGFKPLARQAGALVAELVDLAQTAVVPLEDDEEDDDGE